MFGNLLNINPGSGPPSPSAAAPTVTAQQVQNTLQGSPALQHPLFSGEQQFQAQFTPLIEMASRPEMQANMFMPGRSMVAGQYGEGGMLGTQEQQMRNQAAMQGTQAYQGMVNQNLQHAMTTQQTAAQADMARRTQEAMLKAAILQPSTAGVATGLNAGVNSIVGTTTPFYKG